MTAHRTGEQGTIFADLVENLDDDIDPNIVFSWFHPDITKNDAIDLLIKGSYRCSYRCSSSYSSSSSSSGSNEKYLCIYIN